MILNRHHCIRKLHEWEIEQVFEPGPGKACYTIHFWEMLAYNAIKLLVSTIKSYGLLFCGLTCKSCKKKHTHTEPNKRTTQNYLPVFVCMKLNFDWLFTLQRTLVLITDSFGLSFFVFQETFEQRLRKKCVRVFQANDVTIKVIEMYRYEPP